ncbi:MAG: glycosyltransferase, partial [Thermoguttaceae bacterium]|nr:glycosyltransferase [Thermoguttaceae bacterium]
MSKNLDLTAALIITTYNKPKLLELVLETALRQEVAPHEIIVADDGSKEETERVVRKAAEESTVTIKHVWQEDKGYRLNHSRNNAIAVAESEYITLIDGDSFLREWFIHDHLYFASPGRFVAGTRGQLKTEAQKR